MSVDKTTLAAVVASAFIGAGTVMVTSQELYVDGKPPTYRAWIELDKQLVLERGDTIAFDVYDKNMRFMVSRVNSPGSKWFLTPRSEQNGIVQFKATEEDEVVQ